jgi:hypothetical protein
MTNRRFTVIAWGAAFLGLWLATTADARIQSPRVNHLTFSGPVGLPGVTLAAGTYVFELTDPSARIVRVLSRDGSHLYFTGFTLDTRRPAGMSRDRSVALGEARPGVAPRITAWYPISESSGHQFIYAK